MNDRSTNRFPAIFVASALIAVLAAVGLDAPAVAGDAAEAETADEQTVEKPRNLLRWSTATESENFGYDVYRAESEDGPFERITEETILGAGTTDEPSFYEYIDEDIDPYTTYWYYLESVSMTAQRERFTPVFRKKAKLPRPEAGSEGTEAGSEDGDGDSDPR